VAKLIAVAKEIEAGGVFRPRPIPLFEPDHGDIEILEAEEPEKTEQLYNAISGELGGAEFAKVSKGYMASWSKTYRLDVCNISPVLAIGYGAHVMRFYCFEVIEDINMFGGVIDVSKALDGLISRRYGYFVWSKPKGIWRVMVVRPLGGHEAASFIIPFEAYVAAQSFM